ncbi:DUF2381 family protein [Pyxidicoccus sp. MSG2]|uniref:DUF2381 family protein n=1 Tax=Pyxidicoccus sp. MSG2 TaxID=2996790 RepID=UPI00226E1DA4|nr:DUF2381 family protein [Pyxidicoccus sp. MSG2]MCY1018304.1 DUF2381 family protein [Pyxidicoccus sp. MSG2]
MLVLTTLAGMTAVAGETGVERQMRQRHITLSAENPATTHGVHVAAGTATVLLFDSPVLPASVELGASRERFERIDITERALILLPRMELTPHERIPLTVRFADGHFPNRATFALTTEPGEVDLQVRVFRTALAPEALVEQLGAVQARCEDSGRFSNLLFSRDLGNGIVAEQLNSRVAGDEDSPHFHVADLRAFVAPGLMALAVTLLLAEGQPHWRPGRVEVLDEQTVEQIPVRAADLDVQTLRPGVMGRLVLELRAGPASTAERVRIHVHEQGGSRILKLKGVRLPRPPPGVAH